MDLSRRVKVTKVTGPFVGQVGIRLPLAWLLGLLCFGLLAGCVVNRSSEQGEMVNNGTGVPVADEFQAFYEDNGGLRVFGYPLADAYIEGNNRWLVQYFQRMRLEYDPARQQVLVSPLGEWAIPDPDSRILAPVSLENPDRAAEQDPLLVQDEFLTFYDRFGGELLFGKPISAQLDEGGTRAQYFENARLEWHPGAPIEHRVQVGLLGEAHYRQVGIFEDPGRSRPLDSAAVREAVVSANFRSPILYQGDKQVIFVTVETPEGQRPVTSVTVELAIQYNGITERSVLPETDGLGHTQGALNLKDVEPGQKVHVFITATAPGGTTIGTSMQSFRTWW